MRKIGWLPVTRCVIVEGTRRSRMARARATRRKQEERPMIDEKKAQEVLGQVTGKTAETLTVWADANQRVLREGVELGAVTAKESGRPQNAFKGFEAQLQAWTRSAERLQSSAEQAGKSIQESCTGVVAKLKDVYAKNRVSGDCGRRDGPAPAG